MASWQHIPVPSRGIQSSLGITSDGYAVHTPSIGMYVNMPTTARCVLSLGTAVREPRWLHHPLPERNYETTCWDDDKIWLYAFEYRFHYPREARRVVRPKKWEDLWEYFDCHDLWHTGAWNLWNLLHNLCDMNDSWDRDIDADVASFLATKPNLRAFATEAEIDQETWRLKLFVQLSYVVAWRMGAFLDQDNKICFPVSPQW